MTKVLMVEDNPLFLESLAFELEIHGYEISQATDGAAALSKLQEEATVPDIILSDISMPDMDGYGLLERVRAEEKWREIPFLFLTAHNSTEAIRTGKQLGADDYLVKPFEIEDLLVAIENKLRRVDELREGAERRLDESRIQLMEMISHELNTPLQSIVGGTELLTDSFASTPDDSIQEILSYVQVGVDRLHRVMRNILLLIDLTGRPASQDLANDADMVDFHAIVQEACQTVSSEPDFAHKLINLKLDLGSGPIRVRGYREALLAMVVEPLRNAYTFSPIGGTVTIHDEKENEMIRLTISDEGPGIGTNDVERVWKPFVQIDRKRIEQQGLGIGLPLTRVCVQSTGGDCWIESADHDGTRFTLKLPVSENSSTDKPVFVQNTHCAYIPC